MNAPRTMSVIPAPATAAPGGDFAELQRIVSRAGLLNHQRGYYLLKISLTLLACTPMQSHGRKWFVRSTAKYQAFLFFPLLLLEGLNLHWASIQTVWQGEVKARNVRGGPLVDFALGGLNYQVEHHLFPSMPRVSLRAAQQLVQQFCGQYRIEYTQCGLLRSYGHVLQHLHRVGAPLRARTEAGRPT